MHGLFCCNNKFHLFPKLLGEARNFCNNSRCNLCLCALCITQMLAVKFIPPLPIGVAEYPDECVCLLVCLSVTTRHTQSDSTGDSRI